MTVDAVGDRDRDRDRDRDNDRDNDRDRESVAILAQVLLKKL